MIRIIITLLLLALCNSMIAQENTILTRHRILVSTDIGGTDPDDNQSMIHLLMYANEFDIEGLVSSPSFGEGSKEEIFRMIAMYELDLPKLRAGLRNCYGTKRGEYPTPAYLRSITAQGRKGMPPLCGYSTSTEGSNKIVNCARKHDKRPLWVLVWGGLEDVAQALHDAPDIAGRIRVYWIGGPNKKWGCNAYNYIAENFPDLWFIENNASYRGFIGSQKDMSRYEGGYWETFMKDAGTMGNDFINYYGGKVKMGDTPSLLYLMSGNPDNPCSNHWGGRFEMMRQSPKYIITGPLTDRDTVACYSILEWQLQGPDTNLNADSACITLDIAGQQWNGYYVGNSVYSIRYSPKAPGVLNYRITSTVPGFKEQNGTLSVGSKWPGCYSVTSHNMTAHPIEVGRAGNWFTDIQDYSSAWQGSPTIAMWRNDIMADWAQRFVWLKQ